MSENEGPAFSCLGGDASHTFAPRLFVPEIQTARRGSEVIGWTSSVAAASTPRGRGLMFRYSRIGRSIRLKRMRPQKWPGDKSIFNHRKHGLTPKQSECSAERLEAVHAAWANCPIASACRVAESNPTSRVRPSILRSVSLGVFGG